VHKNTTKHERTRNGIYLQLQTKLHTALLTSAILFSKMPKSVKQGGSHSIRLNEVFYKSKRLKISYTKNFSACSNAAKDLHFQLKFKCIRKKDQILCLNDNKKQRGI